MQFNEKTRTLYGVLTKEICEAFCHVNVTNQLLQPIQIWVTAFRSTENIKQIR